MGREILAFRLDITPKGNIIRDNDSYFLCGRTDFTNELASCFFSSGVFSIILTTDKLPKGKMHFINKYHYASNKEYDAKYKAIPFERIKEICDYHMRNDEFYLTDLNERLEDARIARQHSSSVETFDDFSEYIIDLHKTINGYFEDAKCFYEYLTEIDNDIKNNPIEDGKSYILIELSE